MILKHQILIFVHFQAKSDDEHKAAQVGKYAEDEEILRVPIAIAMVKLLQNMPRKSLQHSLPG